VPVHEYRGNREKIIEGLTTDFQSTEALRQSTGLTTPQIAVALLQLRKSNHVESRRVLPENGGYAYHEHRLTGKPIDEVKAHSRVSEKWRSRASDEPKPIRADSDNARVLRALTGKPASSPQIGKKLGLNSAQVRAAVSYLKLRGYPIETVYLNLVSQPVAHYYLVDESVKPAKPPKLKKAG